MPYYNNLETCPCYMVKINNLKNDINKKALTERDVIALKPWLLYNLH